MLKLSKWKNMVPTIESVTFLPCRPLCYTEVQKKSEPDLFSFVEPGRGPLQRK